MENRPKNGDTCTFQILFTSDVHGAFMDYNYALDKETPTSGFSKLAPLMRRERETFNGTTFMADAGDIIQGNGTNMFINNDDFKPFPLLAAYDAMDYDMVIAGNHEFNFGVPAMLKAFEGYKGEKLCANISDESGAYLPGFKPYTIKTLDCGLRVAFIGVVSPNVDTWDKESFKKSGYKAISAAVAARNTIAKIKGSGGADVFVLLGHMHTDNEMDREGSGANDVIKMNPEIDVFLGAHFHTNVGSRDNQCVLNGTTKFVENEVSAATYAKVLITATFDDGAWRVKNRIGSYDVSDVKTDVIKLCNDPLVVEATKTAHDLVRDYMRNTVVGKLEGGKLVPDPEIIGSHEAILSPTPLIHMLTKIMLKYAKSDIAAASVNNYDVNCDVGDITMGEVARMYVYDNNTIYKLSMTGAQILKWMEWSHEYFAPRVNPDEDLSIPYGAKKVYLHDKFGGINYEVDLTKPIGSRVNVTGMADGSPFELDKTYTVATTNYRATTNLLIHSKDGIFKDEKEPVAELVEMDVRSPEGKTNMLDWICEYIGNSPDRTITNEVVYNWRFTNLNWDKEPDKSLRAKAIRMIEEGKLKYDFTKAIKKGDIPQQQ